MSELAVPATEVWEPEDQAELRDMVRSCYADRTPMYPFGGRTSLRFGLPATRPGIGISTRRLARIVDYPARDMTVTVESGVTVRQLADLLAHENQCWPIDVPQACEATVGGVVATNFNGPRRFGCGTVRDHVIGIHAVNSKGEAFKGGGRVVKNVAGYDFCKLLTGSLGTLGILTQFTFRLVPVAPHWAIVACRPRNWRHAEQLLESIARSETTPAAVELVAGPHWAGIPGIDSGNSIRLLVRVEGTASEVAWMVQQLETEWTRLDVHRVERLDQATLQSAWEELVEFPARGDSPLTLKASVRPSEVTALMRGILNLAPRCSLQAHAGNGIVIVKFEEIPDAGLARCLLSQLRPLVREGNIIVLDNPSGNEMTVQTAFGGGGFEYDIMARVKREFDPVDLFNPGRFVYG